MDTLKIIDPSLLMLTSDQITALGPYFWVFGGTLLMVLLAVIRGANTKWPLFVVAMATIAMGIAKSGALMSNESMTLFSGMLASDAYGAFFNILFLAAAAFTILSSVKYLDREGLQYPEYGLLVLFSTLGMMLMASALDLIVVFIALEIMSLAVYVLVGFRRADRRSNEASMKYFILGSVASAILLYGAALLYGATGSMNVHEILLFVQENANGMTPVFALGAWLVVIGFLFKVAAVPFHMWMPDVYEGAPTPITGFMTTGIKAASFAAFVRVLMGLGYGKELASVIQDHLHDILWVIAVLTMVIGNVTALTQTNLKRMLAYSSIAHTGYLIIGLIAAPASEGGYAPVVMYLTAYVIMNLGAFGILTVLSGRGDTELSLHDLAGLSRRHPWLAFALAVFMFSMAGIPPTAGFAAKYSLFYGAIQAKENLLVVLAVLCSAISVYYYLRVLVYAYMKDPVGTETDKPTPAWTALAVAMMVALTLQMGVLPDKLVALTRQIVAKR